MDASTLQLLTGVMNILIIWFSGAVITVGMMQTLKRLTPKSIVMPKQVWVLSMVVISIGVAFSRKYGMQGEVYTVGGPIWEGMGISAVSQICYESIYKGVMQKAKAFEGIVNAKKE